MSKNEKTSQTHNETVKNAWDQMSSEMLTSLEKINAKASEWEKKALERTREAAAQSATLADQALGYMTELTAAWRQMAIETTEKIARFRA